MSNTRRPRASAQDEAVMQALRAVFPYDGGAETADLDHNSLWLAIAASDTADNLIGRPRDKDDAKESVDMNVDRNVAEAGLDQLKRAASIGIEESDPDWPAASSSSSSSSSSSRIRINPPFQHCKEYYHRRNLPLNRLFTVLSNPNDHSDCPADVNYQSRATRASMEPGIREVGLARFALLGRRINETVAVETPIDRLALSPDSTVPALDLSTELINMFNTIDITRANIDAIGEAAYRTIAVTNRGLMSSVVTQQRLSKLKLMLEGDLYYATMSDDIAMHLETIILMQREVRKVMKTVRRVTVFSDVIRARYGKDRRFRSAMIERAANLADALSFNRVHRKVQGVAELVKGVDDDDDDDGGDGGDDAGKDVDDRDGGDAMDQGEGGDAVKDEKSDGDSSSDDEDPMNHNNDHDPHQGLDSDYASDHGGNRDDEEIDEDGVVNAGTDDWYVPATPAAASSTASMRRRANRPTPRRSAKKGDDDDENDIPFMKRAQPPRRGGRDRTKTKKATVDSEEVQPAKKAKVAVPVPVVVVEKPVPVVAPSSSPAPFTTLAGRPKAKGSALVSDPAKPESPLVPVVPYYPTGWAGNWNSSSTSSWSAKPPLPASSSSSSSSASLLGLVSAARLASNLKGRTMMSGSLQVTPPSASDMPQLPLVMQLPPSSSSSSSSSSPAPVPVPLKLSTVLPPPIITRPYAGTASEPIEISGDEDEDDDDMPAFSYHDNGYLIDNERSKGKK